MEMEIEELRRQRDLAKSEVDDLRRKLQDEQVSLTPYLHFAVYGSLFLLAAVLFAVHLIVINWYSLSSLAVKAI